MTSCRQCGKPLGEPAQPSRQPTRRFCDAKCRARHWRERREQEVRDALAAAAVALQKTQAALQGKKGRT